MKSLTEYINESMLKHVAIELMDYDLIYEKYGLYEGCDELIKFIMNKLSKLNNFDNNPLEILYDDVKHIENIVFDKLIIKSSASNIKKSSASYNPKPPKYIENLCNNPEDIQYKNPETKRFNKVEIYLFIYGSSQLTKSMLAHELTHMYNDYLIRSICKGSFVELFNTYSYKESKKFNDNYKPKTVVEKELERALYMLNEYEKNGFIASLSQEIEDIKNAYGNKMFNSIEASEIYKSIKCTEIYKNYMEIGKYIENFYNDNLTKFQKDRLLNRWNEIFDDNKTTLNSIFSILNKKFLKLKKKLESTLPKKIAEALIFGHNEVYF